MNDTTANTLGFDRAVTELAALMDDTAEFDTHDDTDADTMVCADIAAELGVTGRALRRRLRAAGVGCGQGSFYLIKRDELPALRARLGI